MSSRRDAVFIRKSTERQDEQAQIDNVRRMLSLKGVHVPDDLWFIGTVRRKKVGGNERFNALRDLIKKDAIGTVYVEAATRIGTDNLRDKYELIWLLQDHKTRLLELTGNKDLTADDVGTNVVTVVDTHASREELKNISRQSLRAKISMFEMGSWPSGSQPIGYAKRCFSADGRTLLWEWQPRTRFLGQVFYPNPQGVLVPSPVSDTPSPRKPQGQRLITKLIPSGTENHVRAVKLIFDLYVGQGISRRQICHRLNREGLLHYEREWTVPEVTVVLRNRTYTGCTEYGKVKGASYFTFNDQGIPVAPEDVKDGTWLVKEGTHEALVTQAAWQRAQERLDKESEKRCYPPRNPDHYLKRLFVCGHCGKPMVGRTETSQSTKEKKVVYICSTYLHGDINGVDKKCGSHRISHEDAERMLLDKLSDKGLTPAQLFLVAAKANVDGQKQKLDQEDEQASVGWDRWFDDVAEAMKEYFMASDPALDVNQVGRMIADFLLDPTDEECGFRHGLPLNSLDLLNAALACQKQEVAEATVKVKQLREEHQALTRSWARATDEMQKVIMRDIEMLEVDIKVWEDRAVPFHERYQKMVEEAQARDKEREKLLAEYPGLEMRAKGEALRKHFNEVVLFWDKVWHEADHRARRPRKTNRKGRWSYVLNPKRTEWVYADPPSGNIPIGK